MKTFKSLFIAQLIAALLLSSLAVFALVIHAQRYVEEQEGKALLAIEQILHNDLLGDGKLLSRQLERSFYLKSLHISTLDGTLLHERQSLTDSADIIKYLLQLRGIILKPVTVQQQEHNIRITYLLNLEPMLLHIQTLIFFSTVVPLLILLLITWLVSFRLNHNFRQVTLSLNDMIDHFARNSQEKQGEDKLISTNPELNEALHRLSHFTKLRFNEITSNAERIVAEAYNDPVTDLPNRNRFNAFFEQLLQQASEKDYGIFAITRCTELQILNQNYGYHAGDQYLKEVADILKEITTPYKNSQLFRLNSSDFGIFLPGVTPKEAESFAERLQGKLNKYQKMASLDAVAYTGLVPYEPQRSLGELLAIADTSISLAQIRQTNGWHLQKDIGETDQTTNVYGKQNWRSIIEDVINNKRLLLLKQTIQPSKRSARAYSEILARFKTEDGQILPTVSFLAMAEKLDLAHQVDKLIIETALDTIKHKNFQDDYFGINLSQGTVHNDQFIVWLERRLLRDPAIASKLVFEITEFGLQQNVKSSRRFIDMAHRAGARVTVEKFGSGITSFKFFRELKPDFVKMDGSYTSNIDEDKNNQYFMRLMIDLAHRLGVGVFAESVETVEEKHALESLFIDGTQGYYIGKPDPL